jgi:hypothetical protein
LETDDDYVSAVSKALEEVDEIYVVRHIRTTAAAG